LKLRHPGDRLLEVKLLSLIGLGLVTLIVALTGVGITLEERDSFCIACHTEPEVTYYRRTVTSSSPSPDLATAHAHADQPVRCVSCHGGVGPAARLRVFYRLAVWDAAKWVSGRYSRPGQTRHPLPNINCSRCHQGSVVEAGFENHFHNMLNSPEAPALRCVSCHLAHDASANARKAYIREPVVFPVCNACHEVMGGPLGLK